MRRTEIFLICTDDFTEFSSGESWQQGRLPQLIPNGPDVSGATVESAVLLRVLSPRRLVKAVALIVYSRTYLCSQGEVPMRVNI